MVGLIALVLCVALLMAFLDKHMRFGKRTFNGLWSKLNDNFISTFGYVLIFLLIYEVWAVLLSALLCFVSLIPNAIAVYIIAGCVFVAMHIALLAAIGAIYLWLPCMQITGFKALEALRYSNHLMAPVKWIILIKQLVILLVAEIVIALCSVFAFNSLTFTVVSTVLYALIIMTYCVRMMVAYFDREQIERADLRKYGRF